LRPYSDRTAIEFVGSGHTKRDRNHEGAKDVEINPAGQYLILPSWFAANSDSVAGFVDQRQRAVFRSRPVSPNGSEKSNTGSEISKAIDRTGEVDFHDRRRPRRFGMYQGLDPVVQEGIDRFQAVLKSLHRLF
jgi:hypothetical protein